MSQSRRESRHVEAIDPISDRHVDEWLAELESTPELRGLWEVRALRLLYDRLEARGRLKREAASSELMQGDLQNLLVAVGMSPGARPQSPHEVMVEVHARIERLKERLDSAYSYRETMEGLPPGTLPRKE